MDTWEDIASHSDELRKYLMVALYVMNGSLWCDDFTYKFENYRSNVRN